MQIFLTGGTGFIGSHFLRQSLQDGHTVRALRRSRASKPRIKSIFSPRWIDCQLDEVCPSDLSGCEALVHLAAHSVHYPFDTLSNCLRWNLSSVLTLFEKARLAGVQRFIVAGSCFEYGHSGERYEYIPSNAPLEPANSYAVSKAAATLALSQWASEHQLHLEILRVFHVYGDGESASRFWPSLRRAALSGSDFPMTAGLQIRDFVPVESVAKAFLARTTAKHIDFPSVQVLNVGTGRPSSLLAFAQQWWEAWNASGFLLEGVVPYRENECMRYVPGPKLLNAHTSMVEH